MNADEYLASGQAASDVEELDGAVPWVTYLSGSIMGVRCERVRYPDGSPLDVYVQPDDAGGFSVSDLGGALRSRPRPFTRALVEIRASDGRIAARVGIDGVIRAFLGTSASIPYRDMPRAALQVLRCAYRVAHHDRLPRQAAAKVG